MVDPISGNEIPPGALPEEVRDTEDIKASGGEYVVPADVVRFLGLDKLERLVNKAKDQLAEMDAKGRIGGKPAQDDAAVVQAVDQAMAAPPTEQAFAQGGMVENQSGNTATTGVKQFKGPDGRMMFVPFMQGKPLIPVPEGFTEAAAGSTPVAEQAQKQRQASSQRESTDFLANTVAPVSNLMSDPSKWTVDDFISYGQRRGSIVDNALSAVATIATPFGIGGRLMDAHHANIDKKTAEMYDKMIESRKDMQGNALTREQLVGLSNTRDQMRDMLSQQSGLNLSPVQRLTDVVNTVGNFLGLGRQPERQATGQPRSAVKSTYNPSAQGRSSRQESGSGNRGSGVGGGDWSNGSGMGRSGPTSASMAEGGLYSKGGLVTRRKKK